MALGVDQDFAEVCIELGIPLIAAVPFEGQDRLWPTKSQEWYRALLSHAHEVVLVNGGPYASWKLQARNEWICEHISVLLAVFNGTAGGTASTILSAHRLGREVIYIDPKEYRGEHLGT